MTETRNTQCCIAGCGPAGAILGLLLARAGVDVVVLEKHGDFLRDFRGDTIHASTLELLDQLGLADRFLQLPHSRTPGMTMRTDAGQEIRISFQHLPTRFPFIAFVPQWDFLKFVTAEASRYPGFHLLMNAEVTDLVHEAGAVHGIRYRTREGESELRAQLVVGADGRASRTREAAGLRLAASAPMIDVLWFRLSHRPGDPVEAAGRVGLGHFVALFNRGDYWQIGYSIPKGADAQVRAAGLPPFQWTIAKLIPELADRVEELTDWEQVKLLSVKADRVKRWYRPGYLAIGDAAHAMSPIGGVGINVAIQDAVTAANVLWKPLRAGSVSIQDLARVQRKRELPVRIMQGLQEALQRLIFRPATSGDTAVRVPRLMVELLHAPGLGSLPGRLIALGVLRPHVQSPELARRGDSVTVRR